jgi:hypothetical protein
MPTDRRQKGTKFYSFSTGGYSFLDTAPKEFLLHYLFQWVSILPAILEGRRRSQAPAAPVASRNGTAVRFIRPRPCMVKSKPLDFEPPANVMKISVASATAPISTRNRIARSRAAPR